MERKLIAFEEMKVAEGEGHGKFTGYASVFNKIDLVGDTVLPGAYTDTLAKFSRDGFITWGHDWDNPIATVDLVKEDERGLWLEASFHSHDDAQRARLIAKERLDRGKTMGLSIGYSAKDWKLRSDGVRELLTIDLHETALVTFPADPSAQATSVKSALRAAGGTPVEGYLVKAARAEQEIRDILELTDLEKKEGRVLSSRNVERLKSNIGTLQSVLAELEDLLNVAEPAKAKETDESKVHGASVEEGRQLWGEFQSIIARGNGVRV